MEDVCTVLISVDKNCCHGNHYVEFMEDTIELTERGGRLP